MVLVELLALYIAGLGFFFTGVAGIAENLRLLSGRGFRLLLRRATGHPLLAAALGVGLGAVTQAFKPLSDSAAAIDVGKFFDLFPNAALIAGTALRGAIHSSSSAAAITVTLTKGKMVDDFPAMLSTAGLGLGSAIATFAMSTRSRGFARQIALHEGATDLCAGLLLAGVLTLERLTGIPLLMALVHRLPLASSERVAVAYLALNLLVLVAALATLPWAPDLLARVAPPSIAEDLSTPKYIQPEGRITPETALDLAALEQLRVVRALARYLEFARGESGVKLAAMHEAIRRLEVEIRAFLVALVKMPLPAALAARGLSFQRKQETLSALEENLFLFAETVGTGKSVAELASSVTESLDLIVSAAVEALESGRVEDIEVLVRITDDRGAMMERLRSSAVDQGHAVEDISALHCATTLFERNVWLLRQLALWMQADAHTAREETA